MSVRANNELCPISQINGDRVKSIMTQTNAPDNAEPHTIALKWLLLLICKLSARAIRRQHVLGIAAIGIKQATKNREGVDYKRSSGVSQTNLTNLFSKDGEARFPVYGTNPI
jgi:hypothetical protein